MRTRRLIMVLVTLTIAMTGLGIGAWQLRLSSPSAPSSEQASLQIDFIAVIGPDGTEGEATSWPSAPKLALSPQSGLHVVYQRNWAAGTREARWIYAYSQDGGRNWQLEERAGRQPTVAVDARGTVYIAFVERTAAEDHLWLWARSPIQRGGWIERIVVRGPERSLGRPALAAGPEGLSLVWERYQEVPSIEYAQPPLLGADAEAWQKAPLAVETLAQSEQGVYFPAVVVNADDPESVLVVWEAAASPIAHRLDGAVRSAPESDWTFLTDISAGAGDARHATLGLGPDRRAHLAFVIRERGFRSALYTAVFSLDVGRWSAPTRVLLQEPQGLDPTQQLLLAFPAIWSSVLVWGHTVPAACGTGPLYWQLVLDSVQAQAQMQGLLGEFASYPHLREGPRGIYHLLWTDRDVGELRAFVVKYARLHLH
jgi:hypothetical protein